jgi:hypothetical protein
LSTFARSIHRLLQPGVQRARFRNRSTETAPTTHRGRTRYKLMQRTTTAAIGHDKPEQAVAISEKRKFSK